MFPRFVLLSFVLHGALCALVVARLAAAGDTGQTEPDGTESESEPFVAEGRFAGEQFDVTLLDEGAAAASAPEGEEHAPGAEPPESSSDATQDAPQAPASEPSPHAAPKPTEAKRPSPKPSKPARNGAATEAHAGGGQALYGAAGEAGVVDLATAFVRGFPQVASVDAAWAKVAPGALPTVVVELDLSEQGRVIGHRVQGAAPPFDRSIRRTLALLGQRPFTAKGRTTRLVLRGMVRAGAVSDAELGAVFAIGASYSQGAGHAFFSFASGLRVDLEVSGR